VLLQRFREMFVFDDCKHFFLSQAAERDAIFKCDHDERNPSDNGGGLAPCAKQQTRPIQWVAELYEYVITISAL
jgi:hypothetical protein